jgi:hypothetical protein
MSCGGDEVVATGHLNYERPLEVGLASRSAAQPGIVRTVEPVLGEREVGRGFRSECPAEEALQAFRGDPSLPAIQHRQEEIPICRDFQAL